MSLDKIRSQEKPDWLKIKFPSHPNFFYVSNLLKAKSLHTICQSARCPNIGQCWSQKTATFMILGDLCTRDCSFCAVEHSTPLPPDPDEPERVAEAVELMGLKYAVITSVTRDDLEDGGASLFSATIQTIKSRIPDVRTEVLIPDFQGDISALNSVLKANPDVLNHNIEVPKNLYSQINRPDENYHKSLDILTCASKNKFITKSGLMIGLGETKEDIFRTIKDLKQAGCVLLTIGQYLQATKSNVPVCKYYSPEEFELLKAAALDMGFKAVVSSPLVRSSFNARGLYDTVKGHC